MQTSHRCAPVGCLKQLLRVAPLCLLCLCLHLLQHRSAYQTSATEAHCTAQERYALDTSSSADGVYMG